MPSLKLVPVSTTNCCPSFPIIGDGLIPCRYGGETCARLSVAESMVSVKLFVVLDVEVAASISKE